MYEILVNPITLLCLGVMFLLLSVLFFYFRRSISVLERAQMEQARILQSFITNMEMNQQMEQRRNMMNINQMESNIDMNNATNDQPINHVTNELTDPELIDVSDDSDSDSDNDSDSDSDSDSDIDDETIHITMNKIKQDDILEISMLSTEPDNIKVVQLPDNTLDELNVDSFNIKSLDNSSSDSDDEDEDEDDDSDDDVVNNEHVNTDNLITVSETDVVESNIESIVANNINLEPDLKTLNVQALRQLAEVNNLLQKGEKKTKKELLILIESMNK